MAHTRMHPDELPIDASLVGRLLAARLPRWAGLPLERVRSAGTDHALYRLGEDLAVRLPRTPSAAGQVDKEHRWLPRLAPHLPLAVPVPLALGEPAAGFPWRWTVVPWLPGVDAARAPLADPGGAAAGLAGFAAALRRIDPTGGPAPGPHNFFRGVPLEQRDGPTRAALEALRGELDELGEAAAAWEAALAAPPWDGPPAWIHGDLSPGNLLAVDGRLSAVIDFGGLGVGDPACDAIPAWSLLAGEHREAFRAALQVDAATWARGRGWALSIALIALPYYRHTNPVLVRGARHVIREVVAEHRRGAG